MSMRDISPEIILIIEWGIVPLILIGTLAYFLFSTPGKDASDRIRNSFSSGKLAGLIIFALFVLSQKNRELSFSLNMPVYDFNLLIVSVSIAAGFTFSWFFNLIKEKIYIGLYTLVSVALISAAIYGYLFIQSVRSHLVFVAMGIMLGILIHAIFFPKGTPIKDDKSS